MLLEAVEEVKSGKNQCDVLRDPKYAAIPKTTLSNWASGRKLQGSSERQYHEPDAKQGHQLLSTQIEKRIYDLIVKAATNKCPLTREVVLLTAHSADVIMAEQNSTEPVFGRSGPGVKWWKLFKRRWKITDRMVYEHDTRREQALTKEVIQDCFDKWEAVLATGNNGGPFMAGDIYNMDEFCSQKGGKQNKGIFPKGWKHATKRCGVTDQHKSFTGILTNNPLGEQLPFCCIMQGVFANPEVVAALRGWGVAAWKRESIMMDQELYKGYIDFFAKETGATPTRKKLLVVDGHGSRMGLEVWDHALHRNVLLYILPGAVTDVLQPQDVGIIGPMKKQYYKLYTQHCLKHTNGVLTMAQWLKMLKQVKTVVGHCVFAILLYKTDTHPALIQAQDIAVTPAVIKAAWEQSGLWPVDRSVHAHRFPPTPPPPEVPDAADPGAASTAEANLPLTRAVVEAVLPARTAVFTGLLDRLFEAPEVCKQPSTFLQCHCHPTSNHCNPPC